MTSRATRTDIDFIKLRQGCNVEWRKTVLAYGKRLRGFIRYLDRKADIEDVEQSCWTAAVARREQLYDNNGLWPFLSTVARLTVWQGLKRRTAHAKLAFAPWATTYLHQQQFALEEREAKSAVERLLEVASIDQRRVVLAIYWGGMTHEEAAQHLGITVKDVRNKFATLKQRIARSDTIADLRLSIPETINQPATVWPSTWDETTGARMAMRTKRLTIRLGASAVAQ